MTLLVYETAFEGSALDEAYLSTVKVDFLLVENGSCVCSWFEPVFDYREGRVKADHSLVQGTHFLFFVPGWVRSSHHIGLEGKSRSSPLENCFPVA